MCPFSLPSAYYSYSLKRDILNSFPLYSEPCTIKLPNWSHSMGINHPRTQDPEKYLFQENLPLSFPCHVFVAFPSDVARIAKATESSCFEVWGMMLP